ncbi:MAG: FAD:protein FMN transferase [Thermoanaerobaculaceae bacterium]
MRNWFFLLFVNLLRLCPHSLLSVTAHCETVTRTLQVTGTELSITVRHDPGTAARKITEVAVRAVEEAEARLSTWRADTELAGINSAALGEPVPLSKALCFELGRALEWARRSGGTFDPTLGALVGAYQLRGRGH